MAFQKGQSGNPNGRPKAKITPFLEAIGQETDNDGVTKYEQLARMMWGKALEEEGDLSIQKWIVDRLDGLAVQKQEVQHSGSITDLSGMSREDREEYYNQLKAKANEA